MHLSVAAEGNGLTGFHGDSYSHAGGAGGQDVRAHRGELMKRFAMALAIALAIWIPTSSAKAQPKAEANGGRDARGPSKSANDARLFQLDEVRPGMKGIARTVFAGSETQEFGVEILGVLPGFPGPHQSAIIARLSGSNVEKTGVFAGMSGSPVLIDGRLVGAIAYSFPFSKEPICGITPIAQMIDIFEQGNDRPANSEPRSFSFSQLASAEWKASLPRQPVSAMTLIAPVTAGSPLMPVMGQQIQRIATPCGLSA